MATKEDLVKTIFTNKRRQLLDGVIAYTVALVAKLPSDSSRLKALLENEVLWRLHKLKFVEVYGEEDYHIWGVLASIERDCFPEQRDNSLTPIIEGLKAWEELLRIEARGDFRNEFRLPDITDDIIAGAGGETCSKFISQKNDDARRHEERQKWLLEQAEIAGRQAEQSRRTANLAEEFFSRLNHKVPEG